MINPQMLGMGQLPDLPTQAELWKDEKSKYRPFIIMFGVGILIVFALLLASFILNVTDGSIKDVVYDWLFKNARDRFDSDPAKAHEQITDTTEHWYMLNILVFPIISFILLGIGVVLYAATVYESYKAKTFAKLSGYTTLIVLAGALFAAYQLLQMFWGDGKIETQFGGGIFQIVAYVLVIVVAILGSQVSKIKRVFTASARIEQLKNDPNFQAYQQQMQQMMGGQAPMGPFGPTVAQPPVQNTDGNAQQAPATAAIAAQTQISDEQAKLEAMTLANLKKVAKKLSISGSDKMDKKELIEAILRVSADEQ